MRPAVSYGKLIWRWEVRSNLKSILKVLSTTRKHQVRCLLMGGQACVLYGATEFSRDIDLVLLVEDGRWPAKRNPKSRTLLLYACTLAYAKRLDRYAGRPLRA